MHLGLLLVLLQQPTTTPPPAIAKVEVTPTGGELQIGQTLKVSARALDANGQPVPNAMIRFFVGSDNGGIVDSTGELTAGSCAVTGSATGSAYSGMRSDGHSKRHHDRAGGASSVDRLVLSGSGR